MEKTSFTDNIPLPIDSVKRVELVVAACLGIGYINRDLLASYYGLTPLQASVLLREFLQAHIRDIRRDGNLGGYVLLGYPNKK